LRVACPTLRCYPSLRTASRCVLCACPPREKSVFSFRRALSDTSLDTGSFQYPSGNEKGLASLQGLDFFSPFGSPTWARTRDLRTNRLGVDRPVNPHECSDFGVRASNTSWPFRPKNAPYAPKSTSGYWKRSSSTSPPCRLASLALRVPVSRARPLRQSPRAFAHHTLGAGSRHCLTNFRGNSSTCADTPSGQLARSCFKALAATLLLPSLTSKAMTALCLKFVIRSPGRMSSRRVPSRQDAATTRRKRNRWLAG